MTFLGGKAWMVLGAMARFGGLAPSLSVFKDRRMAWTDNHNVSVTLEGLLRAG